ncbi:MAG: hypothetical protein ABSB18_07330 [Candidatus Omnitrophota bacterium]
MNPIEMIRLGYGILGISIALTILGVIGDFYGGHLIRKGDNLKTDAAINEFKNSQSTQIRELIEESRRLNRPFIIFKFIKDEKIGGYYRIETLGKDKVKVVFPVEIINLGNFPASNIHTRGLEYGPFIAPGPLMDEMKPTESYLTKIEDAYPAKPLKNGIEIVFHPKNQQEFLDLLRKDWIQDFGFNIVYSPLGRHNEKFNYFIQCRFLQKDSEPTIVVSFEVEKNKK